MLYAMREGQECIGCGQGPTGMGDVGGYDAVG